MSNNKKTNVPFRRVGSGCSDKNKSDYWINPDNKNWMIGDYDTGIKSVGPKGETPMPGPNGNWWIGGVDTGKTAKGPKGDPPTLVVRNIEELRNLSTDDISKLQDGTYKGVQVLGYYEEGDTPTPIIYYLSDTEIEDDGGAIIGLNGAKVESKFKDSIDLSYYGFISGVDSTSIFNKYITAIKRYGINKIDINKNISINSTVNVSDIPTLKFIISKEVQFTPYRGVNFINCPNLYIEGEINGLGLSTVGFTLNDCPYFNITNLRVVDFGNTSLNQVRGVELIGDCSFGKIDKCRFENLISSAVATGVVISPSSDGLSWSKYCTITNSDFVNIQPSTDADAIKTLLLGKWAYLTVDNCYFEDCAKRAFKSQSRGDTISNCIINGASKYPIDFQDGHGKAYNIQGTITTPWEALLSVLNYNVELSNIDFSTTLPLEEITNICRGIDITKITTTDGLTEGFFKLTNVFLEKISEVRVRNISNLNCQFDNLRVKECKNAYLFSLNNQVIPYFKVVNSSLDLRPSPFYAVANGINEVNDVFIKDNKFTKAFFSARATPLKNKSVQYFDNERTDYTQVLNYTQQGTQRVYIGVTGLPSASTALYLDATAGDIAYHRTPQTSNIEKYICTTSGNGTDNAGVWKTVYLSSTASSTLEGLVKQAVPQTNISQADLVATTSPVATVDVASTAADVAGLVADLNDLISKYNVAVALINELKTKYDLNVVLTNAIKSSQNTELTNQRIAGQQAT